MGYQWEARSVSGFVQQLAVGYVARGYRFYVFCKIPPGKDLASIDRKLIERYGLAISKWTRARQRRQGRASVQYLRLDRTFVIIATPGQHPFFQEEKGWKDIRSTPILIGGYSISCRKGSDDRYHASVRLTRSELHRFEKRVDRIGLVLGADRLSRFFRHLRYEPYAPIRRQLLRVFLKMNSKRKAAGLEQVPITALRMLRRPLSPFVPTLPAKGIARGPGSCPEQLSDRLLDEGAHLGPADPVEGGRIDVMRQGNLLRAGNKPATVDHIRDFMQGDDRFTATIPNHRGDGVGPRIGRPMDIAVVEIEEPLPGDFEDPARDLLTERRHETQVGAPSIAEEVKKFRRLNSSVEDGNSVRSGQQVHEQFLGSRVGILPQSPLGVGEGLRRVVRGDTNDLNEAVQRWGQKFVKKVESTVEAAEDHNSSPTLSRGS